LPKLESYRTSVLQLDGDIREVIGRWTVGTDASREGWVRFQKAREDNQFMSSLLQISVHKFVLNRQNFSGHFLAP
jgi:hypothetical protein